MGVEINVRYEGDLHCQAVHGPSGEQLVTDAPVDNGGRGSAFSPTDLVATALGGCVLTIMGIVARRNNIAIEGTRIHVVKEMVAEPRRRIGRLAVTVMLPEGRAYSPAERVKLEAAARTCPVKESLPPDVTVEVEFEYPNEG